MNVHGVRQTEIHTAEPPVPEPNASIGYWEDKKSQSPGVDEIPAEMIKAGGKTVRCEICKLIISIWNKKKLPEEWKGSIIVPIYKNGDKTILQ